MEICKSLKTYISNFEKWPNSKTGPPLNTREDEITPVDYTTTYLTKGYDWKNLAIMGPAEIEDSRLIYSSP